MLITRAERQKHKRSKDIIRAAQDQAKKLILQAQKEVDALNQEGYRQGYEQGMLDAAQAVMSYIQNHRTMAQELHQQLYGKAQSALSTALEKNAVFTSLLQSWLPGVEDNENCQHPLEIMVPTSLRKRGKQLEKELQPLYGGTIHVSYHPDNRYVMKCHKHLAEFTPEDFIEHLLTPLIDLNLLREQCKKLSQNSITKLQSQFKLQHL